MEIIACFGMENAFLWCPGVSGLVIGLLWLQSPVCHVINLTAGSCILNDIT